jgi:hypothetical protein
MMTVSTSIDTDKGCGRSQRVVRYPTEGRSQEKRKRQTVAPTTQFLCSGRPKPEAVESVFRPLTSDFRVVGERSSRL